MESIEEIQKEIDRIPPKKKTSKEESMKTSDCNAQNGKEDPPLANSNGNDHMEDESIEQILGGDEEPQSKLGLILKNALEHQIKAPTIEDSAEVAKDQILIESMLDSLHNL